MGVRSLIQSGAPERILRSIRNNSYISTAYRITRNLVSWFSSHDSSQEFTRSGVRTTRGEQASHLCVIKGCKHEAALMNLSLRARLFSQRRQRSRLMAVGLSMLQPPARNPSHS